MCESYVQPVNEAVLLGELPAIIDEAARRADLAGTVTPKLSTKRLSI
jgi:hypothetical protein